MFCWLPAVALSHSVLIAQAAIIAGTDAMWLIDADADADAFPVHGLCDADCACSGFEPLCAHSASCSLSACCAALSVMLEVVCLC